MAATRDELEAQIRRACLKQDFAAATTVALRGYGPEIFGFLVGQHRDEADAGEVFSTFSERVWRGLPKFDWASSFRTWAYSVARNASVTHRTKASRVARRQKPLPEESMLAEIAAEVRSQTRDYLKTEVKDRFAALRETLSKDDQALLTLRVDRKLAWPDLALVLRDKEAPPSPAELKRDAGTLRQRYHVLKARLTELAKEQGLLEAKG